MKKIRNYLKEDGFTLIEMLVVIMIVSVLLILSISNLTGVNDRIETTQNEGIIQTVEAQMMIYEMKNKVEASAETLKEHNYINKEQFDAYKDAIAAKKQDNQGQEGE